MIKEATEGSTPGVSRPLLPLKPMPKEDRIVLLSRILESADEVRQALSDRSTASHWTATLSCVNDACQRLGYSWELNYDNGKRIEGQYLHDEEGNMIPHDEQVRCVKSGEIPVMVDHEERGYHPSLADYTRTEALPTLTSAVNWLLVTLIFVAKDEWKEWTGSDEVGDR